MCRGAHGGVALLLLMIAALATAPHAAQQGAAAPDGAPQENRPQDASPAQGGNGQSPAADAGQQPTFRGGSEAVRVFVTQLGDELVPLEAAVIEDVLV